MCGDKQQHCVRLRGLVQEGISLKITSKKLSYKIHLRYVMKSLWMNQFQKNRCKLSLIQQLRAEVHITSTPLFGLSSV